MTIALKTWLHSIATTFANVGALLVFALLYALLLFAAYVFISVREATVWQVFVTYALMVLIPVGFFVLQASIIDRVLDQKFRWRVILTDSLKFLAVSIPVLILVGLLYYLLNKISLRFPAPIVDTVRLDLATPPPRPPVHWPSLIFSTLRFVLWCVVLPLISIHLWIAVAGGDIRALFSHGAKSFFQRIGSAVVRAFSSESVLIYGLGLILFIVLPYVMLVPTFTLNGNKTEFAFFGLRLLLAFLLSLIGWVATLSALTRTAFDVSPEISAAAAVQPTESAA